MSKIEYPKEIFNRNDVLLERKTFKNSNLWNFKETDDSYWLILNKNKDVADKIVNNILG